MSNSRQEASPPSPIWLTRLTFASMILAALALCTLLWAKWAIVLAMGQDVLKYCF